MSAAKSTNGLNSSASPWTPSFSSNETKEASTTSTLATTQAPQPEAFTTEFVPIPSPQQSHPLNKSYTFWYHSRPIITTVGRNNKFAREAGYGLSLRVVATISTVEEFWCVYTRMLRPHDMPWGADIFLFETGVTPTWEDARNTRGGRVILRTTKVGTDQLWEEVIIALLRGSLTGAVGCETVGTVVSTRRKEDAVSLWVTDASQPGLVISAFRTQLEGCINNASVTSVDFQKHEA